MDVGDKKGDDDRVPKKISATLAANVDARIYRRGFNSIQEFAEATGVTPQGLLPLRKGEIRAYQPRLTGPVCRALGWTLDSIQRMMDGEDPIEVDPATGEASPLARMAAEVEELRRTIAALESRLDELERGDPPPSPAVDPPARAARSPRRR